MPAAAAAAAARAATLEPTGGAAEGAPGMMGATRVGTGMGTCWLWEGIFCNLSGTAGPISPLIIIH